MSVIEYYTKFLELSRFAGDIIHFECVRASHFFEGSDIDLQKGIIHYADSRDFYNKALMFERLLWQGS